MLQDQSRNRTPMPGAQAQGAASPDTEPARAEAGIATMLAGEAPAAPPADLPAPGSSEAMDAFQAAYRAVDAAGLLDDAESAALKIGNSLQYWTSDVVQQAQMGNFSRIMSEGVEAAKTTSPARLGELLVLTLRRELRMAEAMQASRIRELFAVAYPDDQEEEADDAPAATDPVGLAIEAHRAARAARTAACNPADEVFVQQTGGDTSDEAMAPARAIHEAASDAETDAWDALLETRPTDADGLLRMLRYIAGAGPMEVLGDAREFGRNIAEAAEAALRPAAVSPALAAMVEEWCRLVDGINEAGRTDEEAEPLMERQDALQMAIYRFPAASLADLQAKVPVFRDEMQDAVGSLKPDLDPGDTLGGAAWLGLFRDFERLAGLPATATTADDVELIALGHRFDEAHVAWLAAVEAAREPGERFDAFMAPVKARGGSTIKDLDAAWALPGVKETHDAEDAAYAALCEVANEILQRPARTVQGLAVQARATIPNVWPSGSFEEDAALAPDEEVNKEATRAFIESCCALAGVDWRGRARAKEAPAVAGQERPAPARETDPVHALIAEHRAAYAEWDRLSKAWNEMVPGASGYAEAIAASEAPAQREVAALDALVTARPTTLAGLLALTEYLPGALRQVDPDHREPNSEVALRNIAASLRALGNAGLPDAGLAAALQERRAKADEFLGLMQVDGFVPFPADKPNGLMNIGLAIPAEAERLLGIAQAEFDRRADAYANFPPAEREANLLRMRAEYCLEELATAVSGRSAAPVPEPSLADQIVASWREFARHMIGRTEDSPEVEEECERLGDRQHEICTMADNLPATAENLLPKALALAAIETTRMVRAGLPRSSYTLDGRLAFDLHAAVTGRAPSEA